MKLQINVTNENRPRMAPRRAEDFIAHDVAAPMSGHDSNDLKTELKRVYKCAIDSIVSSMKERFDQNDIKTVCDINRMLISCANNEVDVTTEYVIKHLGVAKKFVQVNLLVEELKDLHVHINLYNMELKLESMPIIKKVTAISTIQGVLNTKPVSKASLPETHKLLILLSTYAMSSATAERTFSVMRRVKTWLRSRMCPGMLTNCMFAAIHKEKIDNIDAKKLAADFISRSSQRKCYFGQSL